MAEWPDTAELAQVVNVNNVADWETTLDRVLAAAINRVKSDVGNWDEDVDEPDENLAAAALRMAELMALRPEVAAGIGSRSGAMADVSADPVYRSYLFGKRRTFGVS